MAQADPPVNKPKYSVSVTRSILRIGLGPDCPVWHEFKASHASLVVPLLCAKIRDANRLDRLLLLLDTGSSASVRTTAAKQLAQLAVKSVTSDVVLVEDDIKSNRQQASQVDRSAWNELMSVVARVCLLCPVYLRRF